MPEIGDRPSLALINEAGERNTTSRRAAGGTGDGRPLRRCRSRRLAVSEFGSLGVWSYSKTLQRSLHSRRVGLRREHHHNRPHDAIDQGFRRGLFQHIGVVLGLEATLPQCDLQR